MQYSGHFREEPNWESGHFSPPSLFVFPQVLMVFQIGPQVVLEIPPLAQTDQELFNRHLSVIVPFD